MQVQELNDILYKIKAQEESLSWEGKFSEYFHMAVNNPRVSRLSHAIIFDMIQKAGTINNRLGQPVYNLWENELFGVEKAISQVVDYFSAAARRLETRKRILLLMGPPASGKTTLANILKAGLEAYTRTDDGAIYAIKSCPMQEEPLHLIPPDYRKELKDKYGLYIEGDLCPHCRWMLHHTYKGNIDQVKVRRIVLSEAMGIGIGTFVATDPGSQDIGRLTGNVDMQAIGEDRYEDFGKAFQLNGELDVANRGLMEFVEMFKLDERFLAMLLVLTEEQKIKAPGFGTFYADEAILAHSNESEFEGLVSNKKTEALQDRLMVVRVPYNLRLSDEVRIYQKLLNEVDLKGVHISPLCLKVASIFAILSRLEPSQKFRITPIRKMHLYDGQYEEGFNEKDLDDLQDESLREGMIGISPRFVINQIARAVSTPGRKCLNPMDLLMTLWEGLDQSTTLAGEEKQRMYQLFLQTRREYDEMAIRELKKAFIDGFEQTATNLVQEYVSAVNTELGEKQEMAIGQGKQPNGNLMRSLEHVVGIQDYDSKAFRTQIRRHMLQVSDAGMTYDYHLDARLEEAVIRRICPSLREMSAVLDSRDRLSAERMAKRDEILNRLVEERGYEPECAEQLIDHVAHLKAERGRNKHYLRKSLRWITE